MGELEREWPVGEDALPGTMDAAAPGLPRRRSFGGVVITSTRRGSPTPIQTLLAPLQDDGSLGTVSLQLEREIALDVADLPTIADALRQGQAQRSQVVSEREDDQITIYYDTVERLLATRKCSLRVRRYSDGHKVVTLKLREVSKAHDVRARPEVEEAFGPDARDDVIWASLPARLGRQCADDLELVQDLTLATRRHVLRCQEDGRAYDVALDSITLPNFGEYQRQVVEVELLQGTVADLRAFAAALLRLPGVRASLGGKRAHARDYIDRLTSRRAG
jgi:hypothetical protein